MKKQHLLSAFLVLGLLVSAGTIARADYTPSQVGSTNEASYYLCNTTGGTTVTSIGTNGYPTNFYANPTSYCTDEAGWFINVGSDEGEDETDRGPRWFQYSGTAPAPVAATRTGGYIYADATTYYIEPSCVVNDGAACSSAANSCGMTNSGTVQCDGSCSAVTPSNSLCPTALPDVESTVAPVGSTATVGTPMTFTGGLITNIGTATATSFPNILQFVNQAGTVQTGIVAASPSSMTLAVNASAPATGTYTFTSAGTYYARFCANYNTVPTNVIQELNNDYGNNCGPISGPITVSNAASPVADLTAGASTVGTGSGGVTKTVILTSGTSWTVPSDWNNANNTIEVIGGGAGGATGSNKTGGTGGGGGEYRKLTNFSTTINTVIPISIGSGGASDTSGGNTTFNTSTLIAKGGSTSGAGGSGGTGGTSSSGGTGAAGAKSGAGAGGGGGGAGGPNGTGNSGNNTTGGSGDSGSGGAGGTSGAGNPGTEWTTVGSGGGGAGTATSGTGGAGGAYGAGGGGGVSGNKGPASSGGAGSQGLIVITYTTAIVNPTIVAGVSTPLSSSVSNIGTSASGAFPSIFEINSLSTSVVASPATVSLGGGGGPTTISSSYTFPSAGTYQVRACANMNTSGTNIVTESNYGNNCGSWAQVTVIAAPTPAVSCTPSPSSAAPDATVTWTPAVTNFQGTPSYTWSDSNGTPSSGGGSTYADYYASTGSYSPTVHATDSQGDTASASCSPVSISGSPSSCNASPDPSVSASPNRVNPSTNSGVTLTYSASGITTGQTCTLSGPGITPITTPAANSSCNVSQGQITSSKLTTQSVYTFNCGSATGDATTTVVNVLPQFQEF